MMNIVNSDKEVAYRTINSEIETLNLLSEIINSEETLSKALDAMQNCEGRVIITGVGKSGHIAKKISSSLASTGTPSFYIHPTEASHGDLGMLTEEDVVIAISNSGESKELIDIINYCNRFDIKLIAITKNKQSSLGKLANIVLAIPDNGEACPLGLAPTSSTTATLVLGDVLTAGLIERKGFTKAQFNERHPGGKLGAILQKVSSFMHTGDNLPILPETSDIKSAILEMSSKRLGCVGFINTFGELTGILTDGDLRRCLSDNLLTKNVIDLMTKNPKTISKDALSSEALKIMNKMKITNLFVIENKKPIGVIHIHDLLDKGVM